MATRDLTQQFGFVYDLSDVYKLARENMKERELLRGLGLHKPLKKLKILTNKLRSKRCRTRSSRPRRASST